MNPYTLMCALWIFYAYVYVYIYIVYRSEPIIYTPWASRLTREREKEIRLLEEEDTQEDNT